MKKNDSKLKKTNVILIIALVVVAAALAVFLGIYISNHTGKVTSVSNYDIAQGQDADAPEDPDSSEEASIKIPGYTEVVIPAGETEVDFTITNPEENNVYFQVSLILTDT